jgi:hypothetical protein
VSVFFIPERSILCERLLKQVSWLPDRHLPAAADCCQPLLWPPGGDLLP